MSAETNELYPIFLKVHTLNVLIVGAGEVGLEKLGFMLKSSPRANVQVVAPWANPEVEALMNKHPQVLYTQGEYREAYLDGQHVVIAATNIPEVNKRVHADAKARNLLVNVADTPDLCDFYLGGIVTKGHVKIAISTNGKSPTAAKRLRQYFEAALPDSLSELVEYLNRYRYTLRADFETKVRRMAALTQPFLDPKRHD